MDPLFFPLILSNLLFFLTKLSNATDTLSSSQSIADDGNSLVSRDGTFELGFFSPGNSTNRYIGIWYKNIPVKTVVWVANRSNPINDSSGLLMINKTGSLVLNSKNNGVVWSSNSMNKAKSQVVVQLLDSGNLVLREENEPNSGIYLWQSFDYPTDTLLPGMKLGVDLKTGLDRYLTSWKNIDDPSPGDFVWRMKLHNNPEYNVLVESKIIYRAGPWNGISYSGSPRLRSNKVFDFNFINNENEVYYIYYLKNKSVPSRIVLNQSNYKRERYTWDQLSKSWHLYTYTPMDFCDSYNNCGAYGNCDTTASPMCQCLKGFKPKSPQNSNSGDLSQGCNPIKPLNCSSDGFYKFTGLKMPDTTFSWVNKSMNLKDCGDVCLKNCSCSAYTSFDIRNGGSGCSLWFKDLIDIRQVPIGGQELYVRMSASEVAELYAKNESRKKKLVLMILIIIASFLGILILSYYFCKNRTKFLCKVVSWIYKTENKNEVDGRSEGSQEETDLPLFDLVTISQATNEFSISNKVGEGGFGPVYKGTLLSGQEIAVKRLSSNSGQGLNEFKNEVKLIVKLQHRNLVKLLGCCIQGNERLLIYEYMPNKSLDFFIFDQRRGKQLDWPKRFDIVCGIARGIMYLHQDSRLRIIHRDLKASNILLDNEMNPKISDFGMARTFGGDQTEGNTNRVVGTYGYMAPEYASDGLFSVKSDVFSFGVLMIEIITGKKSRGFYYQNHSLNLVGYAWRLWKEGKYLELIDPILRESCYISAVKRCIHISLLCVQHYSDDRPSMGSVVLMLGTEIELAEPKEPGFFMEKGPLEAESSSSKIESSTTNEISFSMLQAR